MTPIRHAVAASCVFDGVRVHRHAAVVIDGTRVTAIVARAEVPRGLAVHELPDGGWLAPGLIDVQVNGGGDVLFNDAPTAEALRTIAAAHRKLGTTALLPTLITDTEEKLAAALAALDRLGGTEPAVLGLHLEGPFLSPEKPGVHDRLLLRRPSERDAALITAAHPGVVLVTLAPEMVPADFIQRLAGAGVRVALGHSMATYDQTRAAMAQGLTGFTHLFNAMRPLRSREPGPIAAALESPDAFYGLIADGIHVAPAMLRLAMRGAGHPVLVSDAMPPVGGSKKTFKLYGETVELRDGRCLKSGTLAGSCLDLITAVRNCMEMLGAPLTHALQWASTNPAEFLGLGSSLGKLAPGYRADMVALDRDLHVIATWVAGAA